MKKTLNECVELLSAGVDKFPWEDQASYADWLAQTYHYVRHSTRLLAAAAARFGHDEQGDALHHRFAAHMGEEKKHERLCLHDLKVLGVELSRFPEHHSTRMFYEPQYYKIEHGTPTALFGYILPLEAIGPARGKSLISRVTQAHGEKCSSFLRLHTEDDVEHLEKAIGFVEALPEDARRAVLENLRQTTFAYLAMLQDIRRQNDGGAAVLAG